MYAFAKGVNVCGHARGRTNLSPKSPVVTHCLDNVPERVIPLADAE